MLSDTICVTLFSTLYTRGLLTLQSRRQLKSMLLLLLLLFLFCNYQQSNNADQFEANNKQTKTIDK